MKTLVTFVALLLSALSYSQTLLESVDLPISTFLNSGFGWLTIIKNAGFRQD